MVSKVYLVGAGVCTREMLTLRAAKLISEADVLVYDRLIDQSVLELAKEGAELIYMGKETGEAVKQCEINQTLIDHAKTGKIVVRLKSGDPCVFGRGGEELQALREAGIDSELIPGLTSAIALPTLAQIPLTMRGVSSSILILTGHRATAEEEDYFKKHAKFDGTLVLLMAMGNLSKIAGFLIDGGMPTNRPAAILTTPYGKIERYFTTLAGLASDAMPTGPGVVVIGDAVASAERS